MKFLPKIITPIMRIVGDYCNLRCKYCFYRDYDQSTPHLMTEEVLQRSIEEISFYNYSRGEPVTEFIWHGGEPLLAGLHFFEKIIEVQNLLQQVYSDLSFINSIQTNATLIDEKWASFFAQHNFRVGISLDGLPELHDEYRSGPSGETSWEDALEGYHILKQYNLKVGIIVVVHRDTLVRAREIIRYLYNHLRINDIAFNPFIQPGHPLHVTPNNYIKFLEEIFNEWLQIDSPDLRIREIDDFINISQNIKPWGCTFRGTCVNYLSIQPNGNVYPCSRLPFVDALRFGNILKTSLDSLLRGSKYQSFVQTVQSASQLCKQCEIWDLCHNGCTAYRFNQKYYFCGVRRTFPQKIRDVIDKNILLMASV